MEWLTDFLFGPEYMREYAQAIAPLVGAAIAAGAAKLGSSLLNRGERGKDREASLAGIKFDRERFKTGAPFRRQVQDLLLNAQGPQRPDLGLSLQGPVRNPFARGPIDRSQLPDSLGDFRRGRTRQRDDAARNAELEELRREIERLEMMRGRNFGGGGGGGDTRFDRGGDDVIRREL
jgi:hypothetical protein